ncbi:hypothetical protein NDU88_005877 [Pleurodeles waltl]|uniref:Hermansky-Pudlak syndrome 4 protein n=1 Tax=Pleurodeles waltl TaxID=8319 RepID=A0AAV7LNV4_PLEWA|nr:hypothetical protein NDU88_005877 [Pleurodeles waltl]
MASPVPSEPSLPSWLNYFFLYDGSKVRCEGDPTRAGINYFYPKQTPIDEQELLCGQIAGVVCCITEISSSPPDLLRLRRLKFAIKWDGDYLWVLGCTIDISDDSCKRFLNQLIGMFCFYNGPVCHAYKVKPEDFLHEELELYIDHILKNTTDLHKIFNSLYTLDKSKVDHLLLLKAALILQTCQRSRHVLAGCIHYKSRIVSTQLPPPLTAKVLVKRDKHLEKIDAEDGNICQGQDPHLPDGVTIIPVYITREEATALRDFPVEWMMRLSPSYKETKLSQLSRTLSDTIEQLSSPTSVAKNKTKAENVEGTNLSVDSVCQKTPSLLPKELPAADPPVHSVACVTNLDSKVTFEASEKLMCPDDKKDGPTVQEMPCTLEFLDDFDNSELNCSENSEVRSQPISSASFITCDSTSEGDKSNSDGNSNSDEGDRFLTNSKLVKPPNRDYLNGNDLLDQYCEKIDISEVSSQAKPKPQTNKDNVIEETGIAHDSDQRRERFFSCADEAAHSSAAAPISGSKNVSKYMQSTSELDSSRTIGSANVVEMNLYTHSVNGLVLSLLTEYQFKFEEYSIQDVFHSTLASLNGLEVHLKETSPKEHSSANKATYCYTHYDAIQHVLTDNLAQGPSDPDRNFLRAASLMHSDFYHQHTVQEVTIRNASTAIYGCQSPWRWRQEQQPPLVNEDREDGIILIDKTVSYVSIIASGIADTIT